MSTFLLVWTFGGVSPHSTQADAAIQFEKSYPEAYYLRPDPNDPKGELLCFRDRHESFKKDAYTAIIKQE